MIGQILRFCAISALPKMPIVRLIGTLGGSSARKGIAGSSSKNGIWISSSPLSKVPISMPTSSRAIHTLRLRHTHNKSSSFYDSYDRRFHHLASGRTRIRRHDNRQSINSYILRQHNGPRIDGRRNISFVGPARAMTRSLRIPAFGAAASASILIYIDNQLKKASDYSRGLIDKTKEIAGKTRDKISSTLSALGTASPEWLQKILRFDKEEAERQSGSGSSGQNGSSGPKKDKIAIAAAAAAGASSAPAMMYAEDAEDVDELELDDDSELERDGLMMILTRKLIEIKNILSNIDKSDSFVSLPGIVVIGSQSSGKSSVLEAIVGEEFLPKGNNMITRRPIELTLVNDTSLTRSHGEFPGLGLGKMTDYQKIKQILIDLNKSVPEEECISIEPIRLTICSSTVPDLTLVDLPGYIQVSSKTQPSMLRDKIEKLCDKYILEPNIILAICAADVDLANSPALRASKRLDPDGVRTIGVITKMDLVDPERGVELLKNEDYPLKNGYIGVVCNFDDKASSHSLRQTGRQKLISAREKAFFDATNIYSSDPDVKVGTATLRRKLLHVLESSMAKNLHKTVASVHQELDETAYRFKAKFNDRSLTPESYLAETVDALKLGVKQLNMSFNKHHIRAMLKGQLDQEALNIIAEQYWMDPQAKVSYFGQQGDEEHWNKKLQQLSNVFTRIGIGRISTTIIAQELAKEVGQITKQSTMVNHELLRAKIATITQGIVDSYFKSTSNQIENCIKPFKYEIEIDPGEWSTAQGRSVGLLEQEMQACDAAFKRLRKEIGAGTLKQIANVITENFDEKVEEAVERIGYTHTVLQRAMKALFLQNRIEVLDMRIRVLKSYTCRSEENKAFCPEIFANCVSEKLTKTASLFLSVDLLSQFFNEFPRQLDQQILYTLTDDDIYKFACEDPEVKEHIELQRKKELLELATAKLDSIVQVSKEHNVSSSRKNNGNKSAKPNIQQSSASSFRQRFFSS